MDNLTLTDTQSFPRNELERLVRVETALSLHLEECKARYSELHSLLSRSVFAILTLLLTIMGWGIVHFVIK